MDVTRIATREMEADSLVAAEAQIHIVDDDDLVRNALGRRLRIPGYPVHV